MFNFFKKNKIVDNFEGIYFYHIRKTGGTSLNHSFLSQSNKDDNNLYNQLSSKRNHRIKIDNKIFIGWNKNLIEKGDFFYAFSHIPFEEIKIPKNIFTITILRDPVKRVLSHYNMLLEYRKNKVKHPCMSIEGKWLGNSFQEFLELMPRKHIQNQLFMFSRDFNIKKALINLKKINFAMFTESYEQDMEKLSKVLNMKLSYLNIRKAGFKYEPSETDLKLLDKKLGEELEFYNKVKSEVVHA